MMAARSARGEHVRRAPRTRPQPPSVARTRKQRRIFVVRGPAPSGAFCYLEAALQADFKPPIYMNLTPENSPGARQERPIRASYAGPRFVRRASEASIPRRDDALGIRF